MAGKKNKKGTILSPILRGTVPKSNKICTKAKKRNLKKEVLRNKEIVSPHLLESPESAKKLLYLKNNEIRSKLIDNRIAHSSITYPDYSYYLYILERYLELCAVAEKIPTISGFAAVLFGSRASWDRRIGKYVINFDNFVESDAHPEVRVLRHCEERIFAWQLDLALKGQLDSKTFVWQGINLHGLVSSKTEAKEKRQVEEHRTVTLEAKVSRDDPDYNPMDALPPELKGLVRDPAKALEVIRATRGHSVQAQESATGDKDMVVIDAEVVTEGAENGSGGSDNE